MKFSQGAMDRKVDDLVTTMEGFVNYMQIIAGLTDESWDEKLASAYATIVSTTISTFKQIREA